MNATDISVSYYNLYHFPCSRQLFCHVLVFKSYGRVIFDVENTLF
jgi:hypothetical protein